MLALDSETTGTDFYHGSKPFFVTTCTDEGVQKNWEWYVDPYTREVRIPPDELKEVKALIAEHRTKGGYVLHNGKFDVAALSTIGITDWDWSVTHDTLIAAHLLASNRPKDLTSLALLYLDHDILPLEKRLETCVKKARDRARRKFPKFRIAKAGLPDMPSVKEGKNVWRGDYWLPRCMAYEMDLEDGHEWWTALHDYASADSEVTMVLWTGYMRGEIERRGLWEIYKMRMRLPPIAYRMQQNGLTGSIANADFLEDEYREEVEHLEKVCVNIAASYGHAVSLPKAGNNQALVNFVFGTPQEVPCANGLTMTKRVGGLNLPAIKTSDKTGAPSLDKEVLDHYLTDLSAKKKPGLFVRSLAFKRKRDTAISYLEGYKRYRKELDNGYFVIHPNLNITGAGTLRWSGDNPNPQNISRQGMYDGDEHNLRYAFGPLPGREWWSLDYQNVELRIPGYEAEEGKMIELFERPDDPPYFGSYHLLNASIIYPDLFWPIADKKGAFKKDYPDHYRWVKGFGFAFQYSGGQATCDKAAHKPGAYAAVKSTLKNMTALNDKYVRMARRLGYVETLPDKTVCPERGYPLLCTRNDFGGLVETTPLNYHVQGTAMWCTSKAMVRVQDKLDEWNREAGREDYKIALQVHDELVLDFPKSRKHPKMDTGKFCTSNLWRARVVQRLMERSGDDIGIPLTVSVEYNPDTWAKGESF